MVAARPSISSSTTGSGDATEGNNGAAPKTAHSIASLPDEEKEEHAYYLLMSAIHPQLSLTLAQANTTKDMWGCIMARFDCMGNHAQVALLRDLVTTRMDPTMSLRSYFDRVGNLTHQLKSAGFELPSWVVVISIILNLPDSFKTLTETICTVKDIKSMTVEYLQSRLLDADWERSQSGTSRNMEGAYNLHSQPSHPIRSGSRQSPTCRYCKKTGHTIDECFKLKKKKELEERSRREKSVIQPSVHVSTSSSADIPSISTTPTAPSAAQSVPDSWYVDIAFSTSHRPILPTWTPLVAAVFIFTILLLLLFPYGAPYTSALTASSSNMIRTSSWLVDNGASSHICSDRSLFSSLQQPTDDIIVRFGGGETYKVLGVGTVVPTLRSQTSETTIQLDNVLFLPSSVHNLLSVCALGAAGIAVSFPTAERVELKTDVAHIGEGFTRNNMFYLQLHHGSSAAPSINPMACPVSTTTSSYLWHRRFGHLNMRDLSTLHRQQLVTGLTLSSSSIPQCISCYRGKQTRQPFGVSHSRTTAPLQLIHSDIAGPFSYGTTIGGARYLITFIDDYSRHITVYLLRHRSEAFSCFKDYVTRVHNMHSPRTIKAFRSDGALEFNSDAFTSFLKAHDIARHRSTPYTPEQNGVAERANRSILEMVCSMLHDAHMDKGWW
ncbi:unnamed protein product, partial [Closterium sp. NIES-54]